MSMDTLIRKALDKGVEIRLVDGRVKAVGASQAVSEMLDALRHYKADLLRHLQESEPPTDPNVWKPLSEEYQQHHFGCKTCIGAGQGRGLRCGTGASLWAAYQGGQH